jgi:hypothetical protein
MDGTYDDTNCLLSENGGKLSPGILLESWSSKAEENGNMKHENNKEAKEIRFYFTSGVKVSCQDEVRVTVASHGWDDVNDKSIYYGGQMVGTWERCIGEDIGLAKTDHEFSNEFFDVGVTAMKLLHSSLLTFEPFVVIDSAYTGRLRMFYSGLRAGPKSPIMSPNAKQPYYDPPSNYRYLQIEQGIYALRPEVINGEPKIREGVCGTPILVQGKPKQDESFFSDGLVCGFMLWNDVRGYANDGRLYSYCQTVDPLIDDGWEIQN